MSRLVFDAGPLITACKFHAEGRLVLDYMLACCQVVIPTAVYDEVVIAGAKFLDAQEARRRVEAGRIMVATPVLDAGLEQVLRLYGFGDGEQEAIGLMFEDGFQNAVLIVDDHLAYLVSDRLEVPKLFLLDLIVRLVKKKQLTVAQSRGMVETIRTRYPEAFVEHTLLTLERLRKSRWEQ